MLRPVTIAVDDPRAPDVVALLSVHLAAMHAQSDPQDVHALDVDALAAAHITFLGARDAAGTLLGVGALAEIEPGPGGGAAGAHGEIKSMHTAHAARRRGVAGSLLAHVVALAVDRGYARLSLETGSDDSFAAARALYARAGFEECPPFARYAPSPASTFMTLPLP